MAGFDIHPDDLERSSGTLARLGDDLAAGGRRLRTAGDNLVTSARADRSGIGAVVTRAFGQGMRVTGDVFAEGGGWLGRAGATMHGNAAGHRGNDEEQARRFRSIMGGARESPESLRGRHGEPDPDSDYTAHDLPQPYHAHPGLAPGTPDHRRLTGGRQPLTGQDLADFDRAWSTGRNPATGYPDYRYPTAESGHPNGFASPSDRRPQWVAPGTRLDRFGQPGGAFLSPQGASWPGRALPPYTLNAPYHVYEVVKPFPAYVGPAAPWFGQPGKGTQYYLGDGHSVEDLLGYGYLSEVTGDHS